jgi:hypothetical protein
MSLLMGGHHSSNVPILKTTVKFGTIARRLIYTEATTIKPTTSKTTRVKHPYVKLPVAGLAHVAR